MQSFASKKLERHFGIVEVFHAATQRVRGERSEAIKTTLTVDLRRLQFYRSPEFAAPEAYLAYKAKVCLKMEGNFKLPSI